MKGVIVDKAGALPRVVDNLPKPKPAADQILVKSLWTAINPVDAFMANFGTLVVDWPLVLGVDASGVIVQVGETAQSKYNFKVGDYVCGCTRLGSPGHSTCQEYFLMDAAVTIPKPKNLDLVQAATLGVGAQAAALGLFDVLSLEFPTSAVSDKDEWVVILGGGGSVGKAAVQLAQVAGYKVVASCSSRSAKTVEKLGASTFDYKKPVEEQVEVVLEATSGKIAGIYDTAASDDPVVARQLFKHPAYKGEKHFATLNEWSGITDFEGGKTHLVQFGPIGRPDAAALNAALEKYTPIIVGAVEAGKLKASECEPIGTGGFEDAIQAYRYQSSGAGGPKKVVVKIQDE
ncbi:hypothetical protein DV737_g101, partial [Chaetothyriales sp. CBS 132003]